MNGSPKSEGNTATALHKQNKTMRQMALNMAFMIKSLRLGMEKFG